MFGGEGCYVRTWKQNHGGTILSAANHMMLVRSLVVKVGDVGIKIVTFELDIHRALA